MNPPYPHHNSMNPEHLPIMHTPLFPGVFILRKSSSIYLGLKLMQRTGIIDILHQTQDHVAAQVPGRYSTSHTAKEFTSPGGGGGGMQPSRRHPIYARTPAHATRSGRLYVSGACGNDCIGFSCFRGVVVILPK